MSEFPLPQPTASRRYGRVQLCATTVLALGFVCAKLASVCLAADSIALSGEWRFALDRADAGIGEHWFSRDLGDKIQLPGVLQSQGYGDEISIHTPWVLSLYDKLWYLREDYRAYTNAGAVKVPFVCQPPRHYLGAAWYQRDLDIPADWQDRRAVLFLERPHWESRVWVDDRLIGTNNSLCAPHQFDVGRLTPGKHRLTVRIDNRMLMPYRPDAHAVSDSLDETWNGIVGAIELRAFDTVSITRLRLMPDLARKGVQVEIFTRSDRTNAVQAPLVTLQVVPKNFGGNALKPVQQSAAIPPGGSALTLFFPMGDDFERWSEFNPKCYSLRATIGGAGFHSEAASTFGMREFKAEGQDFVLNGRRISLRGTHHGGDFALTGFPPTDVEYWRKLFRTCREWGLNHMRFHSFCPPEAAFAAADETGIYLQIEPGMWNEISPNTPMEKMLYAETERILEAYGDHPSFVLFSASNEPKGRWKESLPRWVEHFRKEDPRHLYTTGTGWPLIDAPGPVVGADYLAIARFGAGDRLRGESAWFGRDFSRSLRGVNVPVVAHEVGQWCAYPDYDVIGKFTGYMRPGNFEIFRDSAWAHGLFATNEVAGRAGTPLPAGSVLAANGGQRSARPTNKDFAWASGRFQLECYKEEIEANLRTAGMAGFQLLDLHDYVGQGTALVGLLDPFWEPKDYVAAPEFRQFCGPTVPLARLRSRVWTTDERLEADVEVAHYGPEPLTNAAADWRVIDASGKEAAKGEWPPVTIPIGKNFNLGKVSLDLSKVAAPGQYRLVVTIGSEPPHVGSYNDVENDWKFWVYPAKDSAASPADVLVTGSWTEAELRLKSGGKVLFLPRNSDLDWTCPPLAETPVFWNRLMNPGWSRMLGLWCDTNHPALAGFPSEPNCDWQWTQIVRGVRPVNLDRLPRGLQPIVQAIDDWNRNWKLGALFECRVDTGKLMVCAFDLERDLPNRPVARQLRRSLLDYMAGNQFQPRTTITPAQFASVLFDTRIMRQLNATATADGVNAGAAIDGDPNTYWLVGRNLRGPTGPPYPHELIIRFPEPVAMNGLVLMPRQNDRDHFGDVRTYRVDMSNDGAQWEEITRGDLPSTWSPHRLQFARAVTAREIRFTALSGFGSDPSAALAELAVMYAGPKLNEGGTTGMNYRQSRSTSVDVDEGADVPAARTNAVPRNR